MLSLGFIRSRAAGGISARAEYHANGPHVVMVPNDPMMAAALEFEIHGEQARARRLGCVLQRVRLDARSAAAPAGVAEPHPMAAPGDAGSATLNLLIHVQAPGGGNSAPFVPASGAGVMLKTRSVDETLGAAGFAGPSARGNWARACAARDAQACQRGLRALMTDPVAKGVANDKGQVTMPAVPPGRYYVFSIGGAGGKDYMWDVPMTLKPGSNVRLLDQSMALQPPP